MIGIGYGSYSPDDLDTPQGIYQEDFEVGLDTCPHGSGEVNCCVLCVCGDPCHAHVFDDYEAPCSRSGCDCDGFIERPY